ncbi:phytase [Pseudobacteriovorax antillogorgiicola]|uniref:3-phytase n=1 Tax=Pseudobacteriovorax antillogorgiicola TaxID=1513793 RepID=A0A1Y6BDU5_9BACT|nr:phytase [Pseudobacteriovorax antillogorgiicola]TCS56376.1 3-phytase [Pseudobacteriovorax antillogorgiicola]SMF06472.1 3-phytase [Pseudobacteriovorax antillogorgiicola]
MTAFSMSKVGILGLCLGSLASLGYGSHFKDTVVVSPVAETTPIPQGLDSTDDAEIWLHPTDAKRSLVLGVSKNKDNDDGSSGDGGLYVYDLNGKEIESFKVGRLNNVDIAYDVGLDKQSIDLAVASNRKNDSISLFSISDRRGITRIKSLPEIPLTDEPYGICTSKHPENKRDALVFLPLKSGKVLIYHLKGYRNKFVSKALPSIDLTKYTSATEQAFIKELILKDVTHDYNSDPDEREEIDQEGGIEAVVAAEFEESGHQLEGCVVDQENEVVYIGMERLGIWRVDLDELDNEPSLAVRVTGSKVDGVPAGEFPFTDDVEGLSLYHRGKGKGYLIASMQGISQFAFFDLEKMSESDGNEDSGYLGSLKIDDSRLFDKVTDSDGLAIMSAPLPHFPNGMMVVHDDQNTSSDGSTVNANYKYIDMRDVIQSFDGALKANRYWNPR